MRKNNNTARWLVIVLAVLFAGGVLRLFALRFQAGDIYPPYSSFRSDPLGSRVLYESLRSLPGVTAERNLTALNRLERDNRQQVFFCLGLNGFDQRFFSKKTFAWWEHAAAVGGRVVFSCRPRTDLEQAEEETAGAAPKTEKAKEHAGQDTEENTGPCPDEAEAEWQSPADRWDLGLAHETEKPDQMTAVSTRPGLPDLPWRSTLYFAEVPDPWQAVYTRGGRPVIIQRPWGSGRIILLADSYLFSNEALSTGMPAAFFSWLIGDRDRIVFDESHFGIHRRPGVATLLRQYRLGGLVGALLLLAGLFVWQRSAVFAPITRTPGGVSPAEPAGSRDNLSGLVNMLRRRYAPAEILELSLDEWKRSAARRAGGPDPAAAEKLRHARTAAADQKQDPVAAYHTIAHILSGHEAKP
ncbi:MAG: DUF4350 domain-containing protein [Desulfosudaceae bacterium]